MRVFVDTKDSKCFIVNLMNLVTHVRGTYLITPSRYFEWKSDKALVAVDKQTVKDCEEKVILTQAMDWKEIQKYIV